MSAIAEPETAPTSSVYVPGAVIADRYELVRLAGQGGVGQVWIALNQTLHNEVALKLFVRGGQGDGAERLLREARAAAALEHPAIVRVFDYGETPRGDPYLVMELLKGESLEELLQRVGPLQASQALKLLLPIIDGLAAAHAKKIVHRDLKPANLFLSVDEEQRMQPKVIDFGLARLQRGGQRVTQEGTLVGTPAYMSPEQISDKQLDARTDVWSLCVVLYELLTGRVPFGGATQYDMFKAILESEPAPILLSGDIDEAIVAIIHQGLSKKPHERWPSVRDLGVAFAKWLVGHGFDEDVCGASLEKVWLQKRKVSSLAPPTPAIGFAPLGLIMPLKPSEHIALAATVEFKTEEVSLPRRSGTPWIIASIAALVLVGGLAAWMLNAQSSAPATQASPVTSVSAPAPTPLPSASPPRTPVAAPTPAPKPSTSAPKATPSVGKPAPSASHSSKRSR